MMMCFALVDRIPKGCHLFSSRYMIESPCWCSRSRPIGMRISIFNHKTHLRFTTMPYKKRTWEGICPKIYQQHNLQLTIYFQNLLFIYNWKKNLKNIWFLFSICKFKEYWDMDWGLGPHRANQMRPNDEISAAWLSVWNTGS